MANQRSIGLSEEELVALRTTLCDNKVITSKYTWWNFVFKNLFQQFQKLANVYFLIITGMQCITAISISGGSPAMLPSLILVISLSMVKDAYEDYKRHKADNQENEA